MDAAERGSPFAPLTPYAALMLAGYALLMLHKGSFGEPAGLIAWVVCISQRASCSRARRLRRALSVAVQTGLATRARPRRASSADPEHRRRDRDRDAGRHGQFVTPTAERIFGFLGAGHHQPAPRGARRRSTTARGSARVPGARPRAGGRVGRHRGARAARRRPPARGRDPRHQHGRRARDRRATARTCATSTDRKGMEEQLKRMALHDPLTLLANRSLFRDRVEHAVAVSKRNGAQRRRDVRGPRQLQAHQRLASATPRATACCTRARSAASRRSAPRPTRSRAPRRATSSPCCSRTSTGREPAIDVAARIVESLQEPLDLPACGRCALPPASASHLRTPTTASRS